MNVANTPKITVTCADLELVHIATEMAMKLKELEWDSEAQELVEEYTAALRRCRPEVVVNG